MCCLCKKKYEEGLVIDPSKIIDFSKESLPKKPPSPPPTPPPPPKEETPEPTPEPTPDPSPTPSPPPEKEEEPEPIIEEESDLDIPSASVLVKNQEQKFEGEPENLGFD